MIIDITDEEYFAVVNSILHKATNITQTIRDIQGSTSLFKKIDNDPATLQLLAECDYLVKLATKLTEDYKKQYERKILEF